MRTILASILVCGILLAGYNVLVKQLPSDLRTGGRAGSQVEKNVMRAESFLTMRTDPRAVVVGTSVGDRLNLERGWYNLALAGGSAFTGLEIIVRSDKRPQVVLIETNVLTMGPDERMLEALFFPPARELRYRFPGFREASNPQHVVLRAIEPERPASASGNPGMSDDLLQLRLARRLEQLAEPLPDDRLDEIVTQLRGYVEELEHRGIRVAFFEAPEHPLAMERPQPTSLRQRLRREFPPERYHWVPAVDPSEYQTTDIIHLDRPSAAKYSQVLVDYVETLLAPVHATNMTSTSPATAPREWEGEAPAEPDLDLQAKRSTQPEPRPPNATLAR